MDFLKALWKKKSTRNGLMIGLIALAVILLLILTY